MRQTRRHRNAPAMADASGRRPRKRQARCVNNKRAVAHPCGMSLSPPAMQCKAGCPPTTQRALGQCAHDMRMATSSCNEMECNACSCCWLNVAPAQPATSHLGLKASAFDAAFIESNRPTHTIPQTCAISSNPRQNGYPLPCFTMRYDEHGVITDWAIALPHTSLQGA